jgi:serine/threonine protein kinase/tetratricopeptide (TPR) repeat protein
MKDSDSELLYGTLTDEILSELHHGRQPDAASLARRYPQLAIQIAEHLKDLETLLRNGFPGLETCKPAEESRMLGDFRLLREVGRGGMGVVYEAEQLSLRRKVALKILPSAALLDSRRLQRFQHEAQAAAQLHHPHIVPIFAVGQDQGIHYYAMQFVSGQSVATYINSLREASKRGAAGAGSASISSSDYFQSIATWGVQAAEAMQYAHELGVVHRDIKPANLLLDADRCLWITDFGLARLHGGADLTMTGDIVGSLRYMAPEQAQGARGIVDHRADIYGLGATLYELLTLEPVLRGGERDELYRQLVREEPRPPRSINPSIPRDLETVVLKAMRKEPTTRYTTAQELADDLQRFLDGKPVLARRPTPVERAHGWVRRNPTLAWAAVIILLVTVGALATSTFLINRERNKAQESRDKAETQKELAQARRLETIRAFHKWYSQFAEAWIADQPQLEGKEREYVQEALVVLERLAQEAESEPELRLYRGASFRRAGDIYRKLGQADKAKDTYRHAIALLENLVATDPDLPGCHFELAVAYNRDGLAKYFAGDMEDAERALAKVLTVWPTGTEVPGPRPHAELLLADTHHTLGWIHHSLGRSEQARQDLSEARTQLELLARDFPGNPDIGHTLTRVYLTLGNVRIETGAPPQESQKMLRAALEVLGKISKSSRTLARFRYIEAQVYTSLALCVAATDPPSEAKEAYLHAIDIFDGLVQASPTSLAYRTDSANARGNLGSTLIDQGDHSGAALKLVSAQKILKELALEHPNDPKRRWILAINHFNLAQLFIEIGMPELAEREDRSALAILESLVTHDSRTTIYRLLLSLVTRHLGRHADADHRRNEADRYRSWELDLLTKLATEASPTPAKAAADLAWFLCTCPDSTLRNYAAAINWAKAGLKTMPNNRECWRSLGMAYYRTGDGKSAVEALAEAAKLSSGGDAYEFFCEAMVYQSLGHGVQARDLYDKGCAWMAEHNPRDADIWPIRNEAAEKLGLSLRTPRRFHYFLFAGAVTTR